MSYNRHVIAQLKKSLAEESILTWSETKRAAGSCLKVWLKLTVRALTFIVSCICHGNTIFVRAISIKTDVLLRLPLRSARCACRSMRG